MPPTRASERLFKYPPMERQDLNQSQLGSFKFTPIDPVLDIQALTHSAQQFLEQQLSQRQRLHGAPTSANGPWQDNGSTFSSERHAPQPNSFAADAEFFNKHIKPDLGDSRLRLGPAALRSAVNGPVSPTKRDVAFQADRNLDLNAYHHRASNSVNAPEVASLPLALNNSGLTRMNERMTAAPFYGTENVGAATFGDTLCTALANEQRAHHLTKTALNQHMARCAELEDQLDKSKKQIASMSATIKGLGAIVKHNASKQSSEQSGSYRLSERSDDIEEAALREFYRQYNDLQKAARARDAQKEIEKPEQKEELPSQKKDAAGDVVAAAVVAPGVSMDDTLLYNLDLLQKPDPDDAAESVLRRTLRKHFSIDSSADEGCVLVTPCKKRSNLNNLIEISPESTNGVNDQDKMALKSENNTEHLLVAKDLPPLPTGIDEPDASDELVTKYGLRSATAPSRRKPTVNDLRIMHLTKLKVLPVSDIASHDLLARQSAAQNYQDENYGRVSPISFDDTNDVQSTTAVVSSANTHLKDRMVLKIGSNLEGEPKWKVNKDNPIFDSEGDKWESVGYSGPAFRNSSSFFEHPVRYLPEDAAGTIDAYRTVMIDGIPTGSNMMDVLAVVRGGALESIQLFAAIGKATSFMTARIVFTHEPPAHNMIKAQEAETGRDTEKNRFKIKDTVVRCWMPTDPTYPRNAALEHAIQGELRASRIIVIHGADEYMFNQIPYKLKEILPGCDQQVIAYTYTDDGLISIEFSNIMTAAKVFKQLERDGELWTTRMEFDDDYTCAPYVVSGVAAE